MRRTWKHWLALVASSQATSSRDVQGSNTPAQFTGAPSSCALLSACRNSTAVRLRDSNPTGSNSRAAHSTFGSRLALGALNSTRHRSLCSSLERMQLKAGRNIAAILWMETGKPSQQSAIKTTSNSSGCRSDGPQKLKDICRSCIVLSRMLLQKDCRYVTSRQHALVPASSRKVATQLQLVCGNKPLNGLVLALGR